MASLDIRALTRSVGSASQGNNGYANKGAKRKTRATKGSTGLKLNQIHQGVPKMRYDETYTATNLLERLYFFDITNISRGDGINQRERDEVVFQQVKLRFMIANKDPSRLPMTFRWHLLQAKFRPTTQVVDDTYVKTDFYRSFGDTRFVNFEDVSTTLTVTQKLLLPVNTDKWNIIAQGEEKHGGNSTAGNGQYDSIVNEVRTLSLETSAPYDSSSASACTRPIILVWYLCSVAARGSQYESAIAALSSFRDVV